MAVAKGFLPKRSALLAEMVAAIVEEMKKNRDDLALRNSDGLRLSVLYQMAVRVLRLFQIDRHHTPH